MAKSRGIRRFLRFSLRSLLLVTLAVAGWLGYEVHQARTVERQVEAIRAFVRPWGDRVEFETSPWSFLRFFEPERYGRRIVAVEIPDDRVDDALPCLMSMSGLRELRVDYSGTRDVRPDRLRAVLPNTRIAAAWTVPYGPYPFDKGQKEVFAIDYYTQQCVRFAEKLRQSGSAPPSTMRTLEAYATGDLGERSMTPRYWTDSLPNGTIAEVLLIYARTGYKRKVPEEDVEEVFVWRGSIEHAILLVDDRCVAAKALVGRGCLYGEGEMKTTDDRHLQLVIDMSAPAVWKDEYSLEQRNTHPHNNSRLLDPFPELRSVKATYAIEPTGFRCLSPEDPFKD